MNWTIRKSINGARTFGTIAIGTLIIAGSTGAAQAQNQTRTTAQANPAPTTQNVNVVNTPTVNVGTLPSVSLSGTPTVNVATLPSVTITGTPTVNVGNSPAVTVAPGNTTNVGRLASQQVMLTSSLFSTQNCVSLIAQFDAGGNISCFDMNNHQGQMLIITDMQWTANNTAGQTCYIGIGGSNTLLNSAQVAAADGVAAKSENLTTGIKLSVLPRVFSNCGGVNAYFEGYFVPIS